MHNRYKAYKNKKEAKMSETLNATHNEQTSNSEIEPRALVGMLSESVTGLIKRELARQGKDYDPLQTTEVSLSQPVNDDTERFAQLFLQTESSISGAVSLVREVKGEDEVNYRIVRPDHSVDQLEYHWTEGGDDVRRGFIAGFAMEEAGVPAGGQEYTQHPKSMSAEEITSLIDTVDRVNTTHFPKEKMSAGSRISRKVRRGLANIVLGRRRS